MVPVETTTAFHTPINKRTHKVLLFNPKIIPIKEDKINVKGKERTNLIPKQLPRNKGVFFEDFAISRPDVTFIPKLVKIDIRPITANDMLYCPSDSAPKYLASKTEVRKPTPTEKICSDMA